MSWLEIVFWVGAAFAFFFRFTVPGRELNWESRYEGIVHIWLGLYFMWIWLNWRTNYSKALMFLGVIMALIGFEIYKFATR